MVSIVETIRITNNILFKPSDKTLFLEKEILTIEDRLAIMFSKTLNDIGIRYSIVAGYVAILFGRARRSDDIDFISERIEQDKFLKLCVSLMKQGFNSLQGNLDTIDSVKKLYNEYLLSDLSIRFYYNNYVLPNIKYRFEKTLLHRVSIEKAYSVVINSMHKLMISPLELQIVYKLYLGSDKDLSDAIYLYNLFKEIIDWRELEKWSSYLRVDLSLLRK